MAEYKTEGLEGEYTVYRDKPLVREGNVIVYGSMEDPYFLYLMILSEKDETIGTQTVKVPDKIMVQVVSTDQSKSPTDRMVKQAVKTGLFDAIDIGIVWMDQLNRK